jgi:micrococcal nuclease
VKKVLVWICLLVIIFSVGLWIKTKIRKIPNEKVVVGRVIDGDTIELIDKRKVRYIGIDCAEMPLDIAKKAKIENEKLVLGKEVEMEKDVSETDKYGRLLRYVWIDGKMVNLELIKMSLAKIATFPPDVKYVELFVQAEKEARINKE